MRSALRDSSVYPSTLTTPATPATESARRRRIIVEALAEAPDGLGTEALAKLCTVEQTTARRMLDTMLSRGEIRRTYRQAVRWFCGLRRQYRMVIWHLAN